MTIFEKLSQLRQQIPPHVTLIAVTKGQPTTRIEEAWQAGQRDFGENYAQELLEHVGAALCGRPAREGTQAEGTHGGVPLQETTWHFIGHLQRNKVKQIIDKVSLIHSVDSLRLAEEINHQAAKLGKIQPILIEVNLGEATKSGIALAALDPLIRALSPLTHLELTGLMGMPPPASDPEAARPHFKHLREIRDAINNKRVYKLPLTELSMGMTHDYQVAIEEGSTLVRIGTGIFGNRL